MLRVGYVEIYDMKCSDDFFESVFDQSIFEYYNIPTYYKSVNCFIDRISEMQGFNIVTSNENTVVFHVKKIITYYNQIDVDNYIKKEYLFDEEIEVEFY